MKQLPAPKKYAVFHWEGICSGNTTVLRDHQSRRIAGPPTCPLARPPDRSPSPHPASFPFSRPAAPTPMNALATVGGDRGRCPSSRPTPMYAVATVGMCTLATVGGDRGRCLSSRILPWGDCLTGLRSTQTNTRPPAPPSPPSPRQRLAATSQCHAATVSIRTKNGLPEAYRTQVPRLTPSHSGTNSCPHRRPPHSNAIKQKAVSIPPTRCPEEPPEQNALTNSTAGRLMMAGGAAPPRDPAPVPATSQTITTLHHIDALNAPP